MLATRRTRPVLRWLVPAAVFATALGVGTADRVLTADAVPSLPPRSAAQLLAELRSADPEGFSGTVVQRSDLGLPKLPTTDERRSSSFHSLLTGTHTLRIWNGGENRHRVALLGSLGESDIIRNGRDLWFWSSWERRAIHVRLSPRRATSSPSPSFAPGRIPSTPLPVTPQEAAERVLAAISPTTTVTTDGTAQVAGRQVYELVLSPKDTATRISQVRLAVDAEKKVPLRVRVYGRGESSPSFEIGFTRIAFALPDAAQFRFVPPPTTKVTERTLTRSRRIGPTSRAFRPTIVGSGWTSIVILDEGRLLAWTEPDGADDSLTALLDSLPRVSGAWGSGRLLQTDLFCALFTDDGRLVIGAVDPDRLYRAASGGHTTGPTVTPSPRWPR